MRYGARQSASSRPINWCGDCPAAPPNWPTCPPTPPAGRSPGAIKIASNETVQPPLPSVRAAIEQAAEHINRYPPDNGYIELKDRLAKHVNFAPEHISVGCGSVSLCQQLIQITATVGDEVLFGWRSFEIYPLQVRTAGATPPVAVPLTDHTHDLDAMLAAITDRTRLIFVCNPQQPDQHRRRPRRAGPLRRRGPAAHPDRPR